MTGIIAKLVAGFVYKTWSRKWGIWQPGTVGDAYHDPISEHLWISTYFPLLRTDLLSPPYAPPTSLGSNISMILMAVPFAHDITP